MDNLTNYNDFLNEEWIIRKKPGYRRHNKSIIGEQVGMRKTSKYYQGKIDEKGNPLIGKIMRLRNDDDGVLRVVVQWPNGQAFSYNPEHLYFINREEGNWFVRRKTPEIEIEKMLLKKESLNEGVRRPNKDEIVKAQDYIKKLNNDNDLKIEMTGIGVDDESIYFNMAMDMDVKMNKLTGEVTIEEKEDMSDPELAGEIVRPIPKRRPWKWFDR